MKGLNDLLQLGHPKLYKKCDPVVKSDLIYLNDWVNDLDNTMREIRETYNFGRGIAAPQLGIMKRLIYINIDRPLIIINPKIIHQSKEMFEIWDDCMSFPNLLVKVKRHQTITVAYTDENWEPQVLKLKGDMSELVQHEYDHLEGILCTMRAINNKSFKWRP